MEITGSYVEPLPAWNCSLFLSKYLSFVVYEYGVAMGTGEFLWSVVMIAELECKEMRGKGPRCTEQRAEEHIWT
jgi:hypothetical protein